MNRRPPVLVAAAASLAGAAAVLVPQHAASLGLLAAGTVVVVLAAYLLVVVGAVVEAVPPTTALDVPEASGAPALDPPGLREARRALRHPTPTDGVPTPVWERLVIAAVLRLQERGVDIDSPHTREEGRALLTPATWQLLTTPARRGVAPAPVAVAAVVHRTLDELDRLSAGASPTARGARHGHR